MVEGSSTFGSEWVACESEALVCVDWPDGCTVFHRLSGKTHLLNPQSSWLLRRLARDPLSVQAAARELAACEGVVVTPQFCAEVEKVLFRFGQLGLARCVKKS